MTDFKYRLLSVLYVLNLAGLLGSAVATTVTGSNWGLLPFGLLSVPVIPLCFSVGDEARRREAKRMRDDRGL